MGLVTYTIPPAKCFTRNPIRYKIGTDLPVDTPGLFILCTVAYKLPTALDYTEVVSFPLTPDSIGLVEVDLARIADKLVTNYVPTLAQTIQPATGQLAQLQVTFTEFSLELTNGGTPVVADAVLIVKGGLAHERWQNNTWFDNRYTDYKLLTWMPTTRDQLPWCNDWVSYLHLAANATMAKALISIVYTDATTDTVEIDFPAETAVQNTLYTIPAGYANLGLAALAPDKIVHYYTLQVFSDATAISELITWYMQYPPEYETFHLNYFNSLGGFDCMPITGEHTLAIARDFDQVMLNTSRSNYNTLMVPAMSRMNRVSEQTSYKANIGVTFSWGLHDIRRELFLSEEVHTRKNNRWWPVSVQDKSVDMGPVNAQVKEVPIEWAFAFSNTQYTPEGAALGNPQAFTDYATCPVIVATPDIASILIYWTHLPQNVSRYDLVLLDALGDPLTEAVTRVIPYTSPISVIIADLTPETAYYPQLTLTNEETGETKVCTYAPVTTLAEPPEPEPPTFYLVLGSNGSERTSGNACSLLSGTARSFYRLYNAPYPLTGETIYGTANIADPFDGNREWHILTISGTRYSALIRDDGTIENWNTC